MLHPAAGVLLATIDRAGPPQLRDTDGRLPDRGCDPKHRGESHGAHK